MQDPSTDTAALAQAAFAALGTGDAARACDLFDQVIASKRADASVWLGMAHARGMLGDHAGKAAAIDQALALDPNDLRALLAKADQLDAEGNPRGATAFYSAALQYLPRIAQLPPHLQDGLRRAQAANQKLVRELEDMVRASLDTKGLGGKGAPRRLSHAVDILFGKRRPYVQDPRYLYFPELPQIQFFERRDFPWLGAVEAATADIRNELEAVRAGDFLPYVTQSPGKPRRDQAGMLDNSDWSAYFLRKDGAVETGAAQCPRTMAALAGAPLTQIPGRAPSVLFSKLAAGARIPPHTGMLNVRLICHLPLVVPDGCGFRVGNEVRERVEGRAWVFDDSIEHEAWNNSGKDRYILLFDIWRPELSDDEKTGIMALCEAIDAFRGKVSWDN